MLLAAVLRAEIEFVSTFKARAIGTYSKVLPRPIIITIDGKLGNGEVVGTLVIPLLGMLLMSSSVMGTTSARFRSVHSMWIRMGLNKYER